MLYGSRITLVIVGLVVVMVAPTGLLIGTAAGYLGGWVDTVLMRVTDVFLAFPRLILALAFVSALGPGIENAIIAIACTAWPPYARVARAETLTIRRSDFIAAIRLQGAGPLRIVLGHVVPLCTSSLIVRVGLDMAGIILTAAGLGFLGLGAQPPAPEWGAMIASGRRFLLDQWWVATVPGIAILVVSLGFNLLGDGLRDVLDPKVAEPVSSRRRPAGDDADPHRRGPPGPLPGARGRRRGRPGRELRGRPREARDRGGVGLREVDDRPRHPAPGAAARARDRAAARLRGDRPPGRQRARDAANPRASGSRWSSRTRSSR